MCFITNRFFRNERLMPLAALLLAALLLAFALPANAARESDITNTRHNLGTTPSSHTTGQVNPSAGTSEICVFCHTPHGASTAPGAPLWNRTLSPESYTTYAASTLDVLDGSVANGIRTLPEPNGASKLCLSCHDGTLAIASGGTILNAPGSGASGGIGGTINALDATTNDKGEKNLGTDLTNDHPISVTYDSGLGARDGEMRVLDANQQYSTHIGRREDGKFTLPLQSSGGLSEPGQAQCTTCHDPHLAGSDVFSLINGSTTPTNTNVKFLRTNRFQTTDPTGTGQAPVVDGDIICVYCHTKGASADGFASWKESAHADPDVADERYDATPAAEREFPNGIQVWQAACLNCHDTHTASGQKKLLRKKNADGSGAQENTCYQCHDTTGTNIISDGTGTVPDIKSEFAKTRHMPITTADQPASSELHTITNADMIEDANNLGININSRHAECTDCHNPHRVIRNKRFNANVDGLGNDTLRTHESGMNETTVAGSDGREGNVASGVLRGAWGVDLVNPTTFRGGLTANTWPQVMSAEDFEVKSGDPGNNSSLATAEANDNLTREYQLCFKCHSSYALNTFPSLGNNGGSTPSGTNTMTQYTNVAAEFLSANATNPPTTGTDQGEETNSGSACGGGDCNPVATGPVQTNNHRSWHPVVYPTGRDRGERSLGTGTVNFRAPWADNIGTQTMQCSDCHGGEDSNITGTGPDLSKVQGPHGSSSVFLLKGDASANYQGWSINDSWLADANYGFCGNCHQPRVSGTNGSAFRGSGNHRPDDKMGGESCMWCHIAVPHGWKNKQFLINLLCVGPEGGQVAGCTEVGSQSNYNLQEIPPYYNRARLRVPNWARSGQWGSSNCGGGDMEDGCSRARG